MSKTPPPADDDPGLGIRIRRADQPISLREKSVVDLTGCAGGCSVGWVVIALATFLFVAAFESGPLFDSLWVQLTVYEVIVHATVAAVALTFCLLRATYTPAYVILGAFTVMIVDVTVGGFRAARIADNPAACGASCIWLAITNVVFFLIGTIYFLVGLAGGRVWTLTGNKPTTDADLAGRSPWLDD
jgi:hypothetical protein